MIEHFRIKISKLTNKDNIQLKKRSVYQVEATTSPIRLFQKNDKAQKQLAKWKIVIHVMD